jgi:SAM-dependent methyltransferase
LPDVGSPLRFSTIAHTGRQVLGPLAGARLDALVDRLELAPGDHVLELGSGKGDLLVRILRRWPGVTGEGFDRNPWFIAEAIASARAAGVADRLSLIETDVPGVLIADRGAVLAIAMGATGILGDGAATVAGLAGAVRPGGHVLFGDGVWLAEPPADGLAAFAMTRGELPFGGEGIVAWGVELGLEPVDVETITPAEWDAYESAYTGAIDEWAAANPDDPEHDEFVARAAMFRTTYLAWRRDAMGFVAARFRRPARVPA